MATRCPRCSSCPYSGRRRSGRLGGRRMGNASRPTKSRARLIGSLDHWRAIGCMAWWETQPVGLGAQTQTHTHTLSFQERRTFHLDAYLKSMSRLPSSHCTTEPAMEIRRLASKSVSSILIGPGDGGGDGARDAASAGILCFHRLKKHAKVRLRSYSSGHGMQSERFAYRQDRRRRRF